MGSWFLWGKVDSHGHGSPHFWRNCWSLAKNEIKTLFNLFIAFLIWQSKTPPMREVWWPLMPTKVSFFAWESVWEKILMSNQLNKWGWSLANWCFLCKKDKECTDYILIHYRMACNLWYLVWLCSLFRGCFLCWLKIYY